MPDVLYVVLAVKPWSTVVVGGKALAGPDEPCGFLLVYRDRETAERENPGLPVVEFGTTGAGE